MKNFSEPVIMSPFAQGIFENKYAHTKSDGTKESWSDVAKRLRLILKTANAPKSLTDQAEQFIAERKFIPGGRYLYATGRPFHQVNNCILLRAEDSREGWADLEQKSTMALMTGAGIGTDYSKLRERGAPIRKTGGTASGPTALMQMVNETGRHVMQGGSRRSAIWAGLNWAHPDILEFINLKNWSEDIKTMKGKDFNFPAPMDMTNISVLLDDEFFESYNDIKHVKHSLAHNIYWRVVRSMLETGEPGFSIDTGKNAGETLRNAPVSGYTYVLTREGYYQINDIVGLPVTVWTGKQWADTTFIKTKELVPTKLINITGARSIEADYEHEFFVETFEGKGKDRKRTAINKVKAQDLKEGDILHVSLPFTSGEMFNSDSYTLGYAYGDGSFSKYGGEITFCTDESKQCFSYTNKEAYKSVNTNDTRGYIRAYLKKSFVGDNRHKAVYPEKTDVSFLAGLFDADGSYDSKQHRVRLSNVHYEFLEGVRRKLEEYGILSSINKAGISTYGQKQMYSIVIMSDYIGRFKEHIPVKRLNINNHKSYRKSVLKVKSVTEGKIQDVYCCDVKVEEHSFMAEGVIISNCTEVCSRDDSDVCNLGSINMARVESLEEMQAVTEVATAFLLAGTIYSDVPYEKIAEVRAKNRRLGLGLMGLHDWLMLRGHKYEPNKELDKYLEIYSDSGKFAKNWANEWSISTPVKTRAIAPTGTIGIVAETTTGIEPMFASAYKRRYLKGTTWHYEYVIDPTAKKAVEKYGIHPSDLEDAYSLAENPERRMAFQAHVQQYVDHGISSTLNLPKWGSETNNESLIQEFGTMFMKYLPSIRGFTVYPDGGRGGQPISTVNYNTAIKHTGNVFIEAGDVCELTGKGGSCGS